MFLDAEQNGMLHDNRNHRHDRMRVLMARPFVRFDRMKPD
jgi:hypothetical protein